MFRQPVPAVVPDLVNKGCGAGEDGAVGRECQGNRGMGVFKADAFAGKGINVGCLGWFIPVNSDPVCPRGVKGNDQNIGIRVLCKEALIILEK